MYHGTTAGWASRVAEDGLAPRPIQPQHDYAPDLKPGDLITYFYDEPSKSLDWAAVLAEQKSQRRGWPEQPMLLRVPTTYADGQSSYADTFRVAQTVPPEDVERWQDGKWLPIKHTVYPDLYDENGQQRRA